MDKQPDRRRFLKLFALAPLAAAAGCSSTGEVAPYDMGWRIIPEGMFDYGPRHRPFSAGFDYDRVYAAMEDRGFRLPAIPWRKIDEHFLRQRVPDPTGLPAGTIVVDTLAHVLYLTEPDGSALRYGVGLGREGFQWAGSGEIGTMQEWPRWHPPDEMIAREPELQKYKTTYDRKNDTWLGGMEPGLDNPLGARAMYLYQNGKDTLYRIHGSPEWNSIGKSVSSGCVRLINQDVIDLFARVSVGTPILVTSGLPGAIG